MFGMDFSKFVVLCVLVVTCVTTIFGFILAFYCVYKGFTSTLPWIATTMTAAWAALGTVCSFYTNMAKSDHSVGGITHDTAMLALTADQGSVDSPSI